MLRKSLELFKKKRNVRPENWRVITKYFIDHGYHSTVNLFHEDLKQYDNKTPNIKKNFMQWRKQLSSTDDELAINEKHRTAIYGTQIDMELRSRVEVRIDSGLPIDNWILREQLLTIFGKENKMNFVEKIKVGLWATHGRLVFGDAINYEAALRLLKCELSQQTLKR